MSDLSGNIIGALQDVLGAPESPICLHEPIFNGNEWAYVKECIDTGWVSSAGSYVDLFEEKLAAACGTKHAVSVVNGTAALHIMLKLIGVEAGDEVIMPSLTFIATANAVSYCGARPHFVDVNEHTLAICPDKLHAYLGKIDTSKIKAIMPVHIFGLPADMDALQTIADKYGIPLIADAAEALGSIYKSKPATSPALMSSVSFNGNKILTTGGGGAIVTNDSRLAAKAKHLTTTAKQPHPWNYIHDEIGYNYRMPNINAALGCAQLEQLNDFLKSKRVLAEKYAARFKELQDIEFIEEPSYGKSNYWLNAIRIKQSIDIQALLKSLNDAKYLCRPLWTPMHMLEIYKNCPKDDLSVTETLAGQIINLPSSSHLGKAL